MILTLQKHDKFGKAWVLRATLRHLQGVSLTYYEDTSTVVDELKSSPEGSRLVAVHVLTPEFSHLSSHRADRALTQQQYKEEVLLPGSAGSAV